MKRVLRFRAVNRDIFNAIRSGKKKVETRAASPRYRDIKVGDRLTLTCGKSRLIKTAKRVRIFRTVKALVKAYRPSIINPSCRTVKELEAMYLSFPAYHEKLKKYGIIALELL